MATVTYNNGVRKDVVPSPAVGKGGQTRISCPPQLVTGVDKLEVSLHLNISSYTVFEHLSFLKKEIQTTLAASGSFNFKSKEFFSWNLQRTGTKLYPYVLRSGDVTLLLSSRDPDSIIPNCQIEVGSVSCQDDSFHTYETILKWLKIYGFTVKEEVVSRVDLSVDCIGTPIDGNGFSRPDRWISRARKFSIYYEDWNFTGIMLGKGNMAMRIYDKSRELKKDKVKALFFFKLWNISPEDAESIPVTRVEFQFRRPTLKEFKVPVTTVKQLRKNMDSLWQYACQDWARLSCQSIDRKNNNHQRAVISEFWQKIQSVVFNFPTPQNIRRRKNLTKNIIALREQARGCILNLAAASGHDVDDFFGIIKTCTDAVADDLAAFMSDRYSDFVKLFEMRRNEIYVGF